MDSDTQVLIQLFVWLAKRQGVTEDELSVVFKNDKLSKELVQFYNKAIEISNSKETK